MINPAYKDLLINYILKYDWIEFSKDNPDDVERLKNSSIETLESIIHTMGT